MRRFVSRKWLIGISVILLIGVVLFFQQKTAANKALEKNPYTVKRETLQETLSFSGAIDAEEKANLAFQVSGKISWVNAKKGEEVKQYQTLATLDQRDLQKRMQKSLLSYQKTRKDFENSNVTGQDDLNDPDADNRDVARKIIEKAQHDLDSSVLDVELQQLAIENSYLVSPINGVVISSDAPVAGVNITAGKSLFQIVNPSTIYFSAAADQTEVAKLYENMMGEITFDAYPDKPVQGQIKSISYVPKDGETGTVYEVKVGLDSADLAHYRLGMTGDITFVLNEEPDVIYVPESYVKEEGSKRCVMIQEQGAVVKRYVTVGKTLDTDTIITSGLQAGDVVYD